jgi:nitrous oxidase accessory protein
MTDNRFERNWGSAAYGLLLKDISDATVRGNRFAENTVGLYLEDSNRNAIQGNRFQANGWAVKVLANATDNRFTGNSFEGNSFDVSTNSRTASSSFDGNWWDHYRGYDLDRDGVGDVPYRPVRLFSLVVEQHEPALILLRSLFVELLDGAERLLPILTPDALTDRRPLMARPQ